MKGGEGGGVSWGGFSIDRIRIPEWNITGFGLWRSGRRRRGKICFERGKPLFFGWAWRSAERKPTNQIRWARTEFHSPFSQLGIPLRIDCLSKDIRTGGDSFQIGTNTTIVPRSSPDNYIKFARTINFRGKFNYYYP